MEYDRLEINVSNRTSADIAELLYMTGLNVTDNVNAAINLYADYIRLQRRGGQIITVEPDGKEYVNRLLLDGK
jgi:hypothetical protein